MKLHWRTAAGPALLLAGFAALAAVLSPFHNTPVQDDWDYARTVQILLRSGAFQRSEIAQATELFSTLWGAIFARFLGFSFDTLRLSTLVLSAASLMFFFALLGELGFSGARRTAGVATLLVSPLFVFLSFSFMTDVPALAWPSRRCSSRSFMNGSCCHSCRRRSSCCWMLLAAQASRRGSRLAAWS